MRYVIAECVAYFIATCVLLYCGAGFYDMHITWACIVSAIGACVYVCKFAMCVELALRHYERVKRSHTF